VEVPEKAILRDYSLFSGKADLGTTDGKKTSYAGRLTSSFLKIVSKKVPIPGMAETKTRLIGMEDIHIYHVQRTPAEQAAVEAEIKMLFGNSVYNSSEKVQKVALDQVVQQSLEAAAIAAATTAALDKVPAASSFTKAGIALFSLTAGIFSTFGANALGHFAGEVKSKSKVTEQAKQQLVQTGV
jgi:hypothetical protein